MGRLTQQPPPTNPDPLAGQPMSPADEKMWAILTHVGGLVLSFWVPLITYLVFKDRGPFIRWHTRQALNFHITLAIAYAVGFVLAFVIVGFFVLLAVVVLAIIYSILAAMAANRGEFYKIPLAIEFIKN